MSSVRVLATGPGATLQDLGRPGWFSSGVGVAGAADEVSLRRANRLVGNQDGAAAIEAVLGGLELEAVGEVVLAVTGGRAPVTVDGRPTPSSGPIELRDGQLLRLGLAEAGRWIYLAVRGGFDVEPVLGSRSRDTLAGLGPEPLRAGQTLPIAVPVEPAAPAAADLPPVPIGPGPLTVRVVPGPRQDWFRNADDLFAGSWLATDEQDRIGARLARPADEPVLTRSVTGELPTEGMPLGAIQVQPSGEPVIFLADHPITGGYPVIGVVIAEDVPIVAQARPGQRITFRPHQPGRNDRPPGPAKVLIANRGEIAVRIIRAARDAGLSTVAVYADSDADAPFVQLADEAHPLGGTTAAETYLAGAKLLAAAARSGAYAVHPGYGFLSENADFAQAVLDAGLVWIGPSPQSIRDLGDKVTARKLALRAGAPMAAGTEHPVAGAAEVIDFARAHGLPVAIKAAYGGGGRGLKIARTLDEIPERYESATREALAAFGRGECFVEQYLDRARHVEAQVLADRHGNVVVVGTRDCTLQRRFQKLVEEAPAPYLPADQRDRIAAAAKAICREAGYYGAGTVEFLVQGDVISFLEVNTRLQVEHPVTEETTGIDLVRQQFMIAGGGRLTITEDPAPRGHSIEFRINGEDPGRDFLPSPGRLITYREPTGPGIRVDSGVAEGNEVGGGFDSMIAKLIVTGEDRAHALQRARRALDEFRIEGVATVLPFHREIVRHPAFAGDDPAEFTVHTRWIDTDWDNPIPPYQGTEAPPDQPSGGILAPMQGTVIKIAVEPGQYVEAGALIAVVEAMKMEIPVTAPAAGTVIEIVAETGETVAQNGPLVRLKTTS
ncbi:5-oxoprolinase/urea amidolyase family protein [Microlunatus sp. GCM10028923]|uniref:5-oxoprolinase/urea amidolyase family protein n=1 Tax=Microlunatus sp. GCM10028923 TaxID=3273400 RepID=UPI0036242004